MREEESVHAGGNRVTRRGMRNDLVCSGSWKRSERKGGLGVVRPAESGTGEVQEHGGGELAKTERPAESEEVTGGATNCERMLGRRDRWTSAQRLAGREGAHRGEGSSRGGKTAAAAVEERRWGVVEREKEMMSFPPRLRRPGAMIVDHARRPRRDE